VDFEYLPRGRELQQQLLTFFEADVFPTRNRFDEKLEANRRAGNECVWPRLALRG
jgi:hypothetical protein